ncbi:reverse transcriptase [Phytophthora megakarya]|uniref:Reverse transcriptase n=1 Tax=Phytophthora megakarya TaxID=4795 RepID=A0A225UMA2_9STRA|nr:reverse transcriptase [Phytophthora megakarya]
MVVDMPWLARHDPEIDWEKRTVVRFGRRGATESDGPVSAADTPNGASEPPSETVARAAVSSLSARSARAVTTPGVVDSKSVSGQRPDTSRMFSAVRRRGDNSVSTPGVDTCSILDSRTFSDEKSRSDNSVSALGDATPCSAARRRDDDKASTPGVDATSCADGCKRPALKLACCRAAGLHEAGRDQAGLDDACPRGPRLFMVCLPGRHNGNNGRRDVGRLDAGQ